MNIKEAMEILKKHCSSIEDCMECSLYLQDEYCDMYCHVTDRVPEYYEIDKIELGAEG